MAADVPDGLELVKDGTTRVYIEGRVWKLRRPKVGEYKKLREQLHTVQDEGWKLSTQGQQLADSMVEQARKIIAEAGDDQAEKARLLEAQTLATREQGREITEEIEALNEGLVRDIFAMLADHPAPEAADDWPTWLREPALISQLVEHWREVPLARGVG